MAIEKQGYTPFPLPITGPVTSKAFPLEAASQGANITLGGTSFVVRVQVSNATNPGPGPDHLFVPPDTSFDTSKTLTASDPPQQIAGPIRFIRLILDSGTLTGANIEQNTRGSLPLDTTTLNQLAQTAGAQAGDQAGRAAGQDAQQGLTPLVAGDGSTDDAGSINASLASTSNRLTFLKGLTHKVTAPLAPIQGTALRGVRQTDYPAESAGGTTVVTSASPAITAAIGVELNGLLVKPLSPGTGVGLTGIDTYFLKTEDLTLKGFNQGISFTKALYHRFDGLSVLNSSGVGVTYGGYTGAWNTGWFNNVVTLNMARLLDNAGGNLDFRGQGLIATASDFTGGGTTAFSDVNSVLRKASVRVRAGSYDVQFNGCYVERLPAGGYGYLLEGGYTRITGGFAQGGTSAGANEVGAILRAQNGAKVKLDGLYAQDYWTNLIQADGAGTVVLVNGPIHGNPAPSGGRFVATNGAQIVDRDEQAIGASIAASTGTFAYTVPAGYFAKWWAVLSLNGGAVIGTIEGVTGNSGAGIGGHFTSNSGSVTAAQAGNILTITNATVYPGTIRFHATVSTI